MACLGSFDSMAGHLVVRRMAWSYPASRCVGSLSLIFLPAPFLGRLRFFILLSVLLPLFCPPLLLLLLGGVLAFFLGDPGLSVLVPLSSLFVPCCLLRHLFFFRNDMHLVSGRMGPRAASLLTVDLGLLERGQSRGISLLGRVIFGFSFLEQSVLLVEAGFRIVEILEQ